jgi:hypothetical protein
MKKTITNNLTPLTATFATAFVLALTGQIARADNDGSDPKVLPPNSHPYGMSYTEWSEAHWQWLYSIPAANHPAFQDGNIDLSQYQPAGKVWFLIGSFSATPVSSGFLATANRTATIPYGKALFFPIIDAEASTAEGNGTTRAELTAAAKSFAEPASNLACQIDGEEIPHLDRFHFISPVFTWGPLPADNLLGLPAGTTTRSVADGYCLMLAPLAPGQHTLHFTGTAGVAPNAFTLDITYHLAVQPKAQAQSDDDDGDDQE